MSFIIPPRKHYGPKKKPGPPPITYETAELSIAVPPHESLRPYQKQGVEFLATHPKALLADDMGLGKTIQVICALNAFPSIKRVLIVCPASLRVTWEREIWKWRIKHSYYAFIITTYAQLLFTPEGLTDTPIDVLILDEAHFIKNQRAQRTESIQKIAKLAKRVWALTGTPMPNGRPIELFTLLQILAPNEFDPEGYRRKKRDDGKIVRVFYKPGQGAGFFNYALRYADAKKVRIGKNEYRWNFLGASNLEELEERLKASVMLRRTKTEVLDDLPERQRQVVTFNRVSEGPIDPRFYAWNADNFDEKLAELESNKIRFDEMSRIRHEQAMAKVDDICLFLSETYDPEQKVVIFAHHRDVAKRIKQTLAQKGSVMLTGDMNQAERQMAIDLFIEDPECRFFVGTLHAAGIGLTLTVASRVVFAELDWRPDVMRQAEDRIYRIGQKNSVLSQWCVVDGTIDAVLAKCLTEKMQHLEKAGLA